MSRPDQGKCITENFDFFIALGHEKRISYRKICRILILRGLRRQILLSAANISRKLNINSEKDCFDLLFQEITALPEREPLAPSSVPSMASQLSLLSRMSFLCQGSRIMI
ncbi:hypothetical protein FOXYSP1_02086 [Fusarium oxysporum f. sp. phaseoli]